MFYKPKQNFQKTMKEAKIDISVFQKKKKTKKTQTQAFAMASRY